MRDMLTEPDLKRLAWRAHHRGTKEADLMIGGFFDAHSIAVGARRLVRCSAEMLHEQDVDIMSWALGTAPPPERFAGPMIDALRKLDYIRIAK